MVMLLKIDIWMDKIQNYGWKIEDAPNEEIREELRRRLGGTSGSKTNKENNLTIS